MSVMGLWTLMTLLAVAVALLNDVHRNNPGKMMSGIDDQLLPIAIAVIFVVYVSKLSRRQLDIQEHFLSICRFFIYLLCLNTFVALLQTQAGFSEYLKIFWTGDVSGTGLGSVGELALENGRLTGIFNAPADSGIAYSMGLFAWIYRYSFQCIKRSDYMMLVGLLIGGTLAASKMCLLGALPLCILFFLFKGGSESLGKRSLRMVAVGSIIYLSVFILQYLAKDLWHGTYQLHEMQSDNNQNTLAALTSGRYSTTEEGAFSYLVGQIWQANPFLGTGFGFLSVVDSSYLNVYMISGLIGLFLYLVMLWVMYWEGFNAKSTHNRWDVKLLYLIMVTYIFGGGFGTALLVANRASTMAWVMFWLFSYTIVLMDQRVYRLQRINSQHIPNSGSPVSSQNPVSI